MTKYLTKSQTSAVGSELNGYRIVFWPCVCVLDNSAVLDTQSSKRQCSEHKTIYVLKTIKQIDFAALALAGV